MVPTVNADGDTAKQITDMQTLVARNVKGIFLIPRDSDAPSCPASKLPTTRTSSRPSNQLRPPRHAGTRAPGMLSTIETCLDAEYMRRHRRPLPLPPISPTSRGTSSKKGNTCLT
jgi:hypothetical protein